MITFEKTLGPGTCGFEVKIQISSEDQNRLTRVPLAFQIKNYDGGTWQIGREFLNPDIVTTKSEEDRYFWSGHFREGIWMGYFNTSGRGEEQLEIIKAKMTADLSLAVDTVLQRVRNLP
jgi:hypothetical protein